MNIKKIIKYVFVNTLSISILLGNHSISNANALNSNIMKTALEENVNIIIIDEDEKPITEYHSDGIQVNYTYEADQTNQVRLKSINNNKGVTESISYYDDKTVMITSLNDEIISTKEIEIASGNNMLSDNELNLDTTEIIKAAQLPYDEKYNISMLSDTIIDNYNISTICPSVWTVKSGSDRFARPSTAMTKTQIQNLLKKYDSVLQNSIKIWKKTSSGSIVDTGRTVKPSAVIDEASRNYAINPKIIIGSLQREQSLIKKTDIQVKSSNLWYAMGYYVTDSGTNNNYSGFDTQVDKGTRLYLSLWNEGHEKGEKGFPLIFKASDGDVQINNCGTYALYRYTPWKSSNKLFLQVMKSLFPGNGVNGIDWN